MGNVEAQKWYHDDLDTEKKLKIDQSINTIFIWLSISQEERRKQFTSTRQYRKPGKRRKYFTQCLQQLVDARRRLCSDEKVVRNDAFQYVDTFIDNLPQQFKTKYHNNAVENKEIEQFKKDKIIQDAVIDGLNTCINVEKNSDNNNETNKDEEEKLSVSFKPERIPKEDPGDGLPSKPPAVIEFKWMETKKQCVTQHMLYLLQLALNLIGRTVILQLNILNYYQLVVRNKYFKSIGRTDRFINQLDNP
eukprot:259085_1